MPIHLFEEEPVAALKDKELVSARAKVAQLTPQQLEAPDLAEQLESISKFKFHVARLRPDEKKGKRRIEQRSIMDYGRQIVIERDVIDISVPFDGWPRSFSLAPSSRELIETPATIESSALVVSFDDDEDLERKLSIFISRASNNLHSLEGEISKIQAEVLKEVQNVVDQRTRVLRERRDRDKTRSFPIE